MHACAMYALLTCTGMCTHVCVHACGGPRFAPYHSLYFEFLPEPGVHWLSRVAGQLTLRDPSVSVSPLGLSDTVQLSDAVPNHRCGPKSQMPYPSSAFYFGTRDPISLGTAYTYPWSHPTSYTTVLLFFNMSHQRDKQASIKV